MSTEEKPKSKESEAAENMESEMEDREDARLQAERAEQEDLNQGVQTGTHDSMHRGVKWGPSYRTRSKRGKQNKVPEEGKNKSD